MTDTAAIRAAKLAVQYATNRTKFAAISKQINAFPAFDREGGQIYLDDVREEYLEDGDRWRGWMHAIGHVLGNRDSDDQECITAEQRELAALLDQKAALRVEAGRIKTNIASLGRMIIRAGS